MKAERWRSEAIAHAERAFSGQKGRKADCADRSSAEEEEEEAAAAVML